MISLYEYITESLNDKIFVIIKPGFLNLSDEILEKFTSNGYELYQMKTKKLLLSEAKELYSIHKEEDFYDDLCKYMSSDLSTAIIFKNSNSKNIFEDTKKIKDSIREQYGESDMRNVIHSSDSLSHMINEQSIYFNDI